MDEKILVLTLFHIILTFMEESLLLIQEVGDVDCLSGFGYDFSSLITWLVGERSNCEHIFLKGHIFGMSLFVFSLLLLGSFWVFFVTFLIIPSVSIICVTWLQKDAYATFVCHFDVFEIWLLFFPLALRLFISPPNLSCYFFCCVFWTRELWNAFLVARFYIQMPV